MCKLAKIIILTEINTHGSQGLQPRYNDILPFKSARFATTNIL